MTLIFFVRVAYVFCFKDNFVNYLGNRDPQVLVCLHEEQCVAIGIAHGYAKVTD